MAAFLIVTPAQVAAMTGTAEATTAAILLGEPSIGKGQVAGLARTLGVIPAIFFAD